MALPSGYMLGSGFGSTSSFDLLGPIPACFIMAGIDPREAIPFWERMGQQEGKSRPPEFLSTHPATATRIADIKKYIPEALPYYDKTKK